MMLDATFFLSPYSLYIGSMWVVIGPQFSSHIGRTQRDECGGGWARGYVKGPDEEESNSYRPPPFCSSSCVRFKGVSAIFHRTRIHTSLIFHLLLFMYLHPATTAT